MVGGRWYGKLVGRVEVETRVCSRENRVGVNSRSLPPPSRIRTVGFTRKDKVRAVQSGKAIVSIAYRGGEFKKGLGHDRDILLPHLSIRLSPYLPLCSTSYKHYYWV